MAEAAGLVIGVVGLATLFDTCIAAFDKVDTYHQYGSTNRQLQVRFENQKFLLEDFKSRAATMDDKTLPHGPGMDMYESAREQRIKDTLICINESLEAINRHLEHRTRSASPALAIPMGDPALGHVRNTAKTKPSLRHKIKFAVGGKDRLAEQVDWFEKMVQGLSDLSTPTNAPSSGMDLSRYSSHQGHSPSSCIPNHDPLS